MGAELEDGRVVKKDGLKLQVQVLIIVILLILL